MPLRSGRSYLVDARYVWTAEPFNPDALVDRRRIMRAEKAFVRRVVAPYIHNYDANMPFDMKWLRKFRWICSKSYDQYYPPEDLCDDPWPMYEDDD